MVGGVATGLTVGAGGVAAGTVGVGVGVGSSSSSSPPDGKYDYISSNVNVEWDCPSLVL